jgi:hypothetical protein
MIFTRRPTWLLLVAGAATGPVRTCAAVMGTTDFFPALNGGRRPHSGIVKARIERFRNRTGTARR